MRNGGKVLAVGLLFLLLSVQVFGYAFAYDEPDNFAGLKFGEDLTKQVDECPYSSFAAGAIPDFAKIRASGSRCYTDVMKMAKNNPEKVHFQLYNMGEIQSQVSTIYATNRDAKLAYVELVFPSSRASVLLAIFTQRYGKPTSQSQQPWMSKGGVKTTSTVTIWKGKNVSIVFDERAGDIDNGSITYETEKAAADRRQREADVIRKGAKGL